MKLFEEIDKSLLRHTKIEGSSIKKVDGEDNVFKIVISTNQVDRYGEVVIQDGIDITNYMKNPIVLWGHDYYLPPIGKTVEIVKQKTKTIAKFIFAKTQFAQEIKSLVEGGFVNMSSIGFISHDFDRDSMTHRKSELLEYSLVDVPANPGAEMQRLFAKGIKDLNCKEVEAYVCKRGNLGCKIYAGIMNELKSLENEDAEADLSNDKNEDNTVINEEGKQEVKEEQKLKFDLKDAEEVLNVIKEEFEEEEVKELCTKLNGEVEIKEEEKSLLETICKMVLCIKKKNDIISEINQEQSKSEKPLTEKIDQIDEKLDKILQGYNAKFEEDEGKGEDIKQLTKIASKSINAALSLINKKDNGN